MDLRANAIITAVDRFSGPVGQMAGALNRIRGASTGLASAAKRTGAALAGPGGLGAAFGGAMFLQRQLQFEESLNRTQAILDITRKEAFAPLRDDIIRISKEYPALRDEIAKGASELAMAGMGLDTIRAVLEATVQGSMASGESIKTVGEGVTDVVLGMAMPFKTAAEQAKSFHEVNNLLAASSTSANDTYVGFLESIRRAGPVARMVGTDLLSLAAAHAVLANAGIKSERAGIALRTMQVRALAPTKKAREMMRAQNIDWTKWMRLGDGNLSSGGLMDMLAESGVNTGNISALTKDKIEKALAAPGAKTNLGVLGDTLTDIVGDSLGISADEIEDRSKLSDTIRQYLTSQVAKLDFSALFKELADKKANVSVLKELLSLFHIEKAAVLQDALDRNVYEEMRGTIEGKIPGAVERRSGIMMQGFVGAWHRMRSAFDALLDTLANTGVMDTLTTVFDKMTAGLNALGESNPELLKWGTYAVLAAGAIGTLSFALSSLAAAVPFAAIAGGIIAMKSGLETFYTWMTGWIDRIGAAMKALKEGRFRDAGGILSGRLTPDGANADALRTLSMEWQETTRPMLDVLPPLAKTVGELNRSLNDGLDRVYADRSDIMQLFAGASERPITGADLDENLQVVGRGRVTDMTTLDVTGKVHADVAGTVEGAMRVEVDIKVDGPGVVTDKRTSGGEVKGQLRTGKSMPDVVAP
jgi:hypothetical protein